MKEAKSKNTLTEKLLLTSGSHSRVEDGVRVRYHAGDIIEITARERAMYPDRFMSVEEYEAQLAEFEDQRAKDAQLKAAARNVKKGARDPKARKRGERLLEMRKPGKGLTV